MKKRLFFAFGAAALLASCSNDIDAPQMGQEGQLQVNATIEGLKTRASETSWAVNDQIGITDDKGHTNVAYKATTASGDFTAVGDGITLVGKDTYTFNAYYPYTANGGEVTFKVVDDSYAPATQSEIDFLYASGATAVRTNPKADFTFKHKMSRLALKFTNTENTLESNATVEVTISNVATSGKFNTATGIVTADPAEGYVKVSNLAIGTQSSFILPSFTTANDKDIDVTVVLTNGDDVVNYSGTLKPALEAGKQYTYTLDIEYGKGLVINSGTITGWDEITGDGQIKEGGETPELPEPEHQTVVGDFLLNDGSILDYTNAEEVTAQKANIIGVVYYVGNPQPSALYPSKEYGEIDVLKQDFQNCTHGLAIALENGNDNQPIRFATGKYNFTTWDGKDSYITGNLSLTFFPEEWLGYNNTQVIKKATEALSSSETQTGCQQVIDFLNSYSEKYQVSNASTWYLPSYGEFAEIIKNLDVIQNSLGLLDKALEKYESFDPTINTNSDCFYWTSDFRSQDYTWVTPLVKHETLDKGYYAPRATSSDKGFFRFAIAF